ncbi:tryptophan halogenase family protein [Sphingomonas sp. S2-65]|uniref:tryptophan halogenase family protein n=1 Tax=Sphingomonas sp. S2-65 TaxID=2903960 RepID=UPI001F26567E|nr:tryptophan halogenase family protein [Sphingomonas sp. S2-65]UYY59315.1 tryptophan 7-halogenase [Sphingomonas sp. S2-65]
MTAPARIRRLVIVGGGTAGWMAAAALARVLGPRGPAITLIESDAIGTVGVGEATIPPITLFNKLIGLDEDAFIRATGATFKLGIEFVDWLRIGHRYLHSFGLYGADMNGIAFTHYMLRAMREGEPLDRDHFNAEALAARRGRFGRTPPGSPATLPKINYAFQFDAGLYAGHLRRHAETIGVKRVEGQVVSVEREPEREGIRSLSLDDGRRFEGDLFVDCSGFRGLLIEEALGAGYVDWSEWLPANRAIAVPSERLPVLPPFTHATARDAGWQWRIPLQHRTGNGYVYCDAFASEEEATRTLLDQLDGPPTAEPRMLRFAAGYRRRQWVGNCVSLGLASGFLEPLESTSIHLVQAGIAKLLALFPQGTPDPALVERFNGEMAVLYEGIRDFLIAHYALTEREDTPFWRHCRAMRLPDSLLARLDRFRARGEAGAGGMELFRDTNWFAILHGQGLEPGDYHPVADAMPAELLRDRLGQARAAIERRVAALPLHDDMLAAIVEGA